MVFSLKTFLKSFQRYGFFWLMYNIFLFLPVFCGQVPHNSHLCKINNVRSKTRVYMQYQSKNKSDHVLSNLPANLQQIFDIRKSYTKKSPRRAIFFYLVLGHLVPLLDFLTLYIVHCPFVHYVDLSVTQNLCTLYFVT